MEGVFGELQKSAPTLVRNGQKEKDHVLSPGGSFQFIRDGIDNGSINSNRREWEGDIQG